ncbi:unnamed protein product [Rhodiola kirilowii]
MDIEIHLQSMGLSETIKEGNEPSEIDMAKSLIFIRRHLHEDLKNEYLTMKNPCELWKNLKERYDHQKAVLRDTKTDDEMLEKTLSTFHASNVTLQQQYRVRGFQRYSELIACLLIMEKNNELLIKNHQSCRLAQRHFLKQMLFVSTQLNIKIIFKVESIAEVVGEVEVEVVVNDVVEVVIFIIHLIRSPNMATRTIKMGGIMRIPTKGKMTPAPRKVMKLLVSDA